jgi:hypothetical protein
LSVLIFAAAIPGCGGSTERDGSGAAPGSGGAISGTGGGNGTGGQTGSGGSSAPAGGSAGDSNDDEAAAACGSSSPTRFACDAGATRYFHDVATGECSGVGPSDCVSAFLFGSLAECLTSCPGSRPALTACDRADECELVPTGCCGGCEPVTESVLTAVNSARTSDVAGCEDGVLCGACPEVEEYETTGEYFVGSCLGGQCTVRDLRLTDDAECQSDEDCFLRNGSGCCESCDDTGYVALSGTDLLVEQCGAGVACAVCETEPPEGLSAFCDNGTGRCAKRQNAL